MHLYSISVISSAYYMEISLFGLAFWQHVFLVTCYVNDHCHEKSKDLVVTMEIDYMNLLALWRFTLCACCLLTWTKVKERTNTTRWLYNFLLSFHWFIWKPSLGVVIDAISDQNKLITAGHALTVSAAVWVTVRRGIRPWFLTLLNWFLWTNTTKTR